MSERDRRERYTPTRPLPGVPGRPPADTTAVWRALAASAAEVCARWQVNELGPISVGDVRATTAILCDGIRQAVGGHAPRLSDLPPFVPARRILEGLRGALLERVGSQSALDDDPRQTVRVLAAMERVQRALDQDAAQRFASRLSGHDAVQLIVEVAHDMRSPLGAILLLAERLRTGRSGGITQLQERQLGLIYSAAFGLSAIASDVIELARGGTGLVDQEPLPFSVSEVLHSMVDILRPMAEEKGLTMQCIAPQADVRVGHAAALNRVLLNLTTNAIKFTDAGTVVVTCRELDRTRIEFSVRDSGRGIPAEVRATLFETFRQRQVPGDYAFSSAGLGLSICQKLVAAMGGELAFETEQGVGTRFYFVLTLPQAARF